MTPTLQAEQIFNYYFIKENISGRQARLMALYTVQQVINANPHSNPVYDGTPTPTMGYWMEVKKELQKK